MGEGKLAAVLAKSISWDTYRKAALHLGENVPLITNADVVHETY
jgi:hypothetical protein